VLRLALVTGAPLWARVGLQDWSFWPGWYGGGGQRVSWLWRGRPWRWRSWLPLGVKVDAGDGQLGGYVTDHLRNLAVVLFKRQQAFHDDR